MSGQGRPSRYTRSFGGHDRRACIVTVLLRDAPSCAWRGLFRTDADDTPVAVDWQESVELADQAGLQVVRPARAAGRAGPRRAWTCPPATTRAGGSACSPTTATSSASGSRTPRSTRSSSTYVDEKAEAGDDATVPSEVTDTWQTWSDDGGDHGYSTEVGDEAVLVYGSGARSRTSRAYLGLLYHAGLRSVGVGSAPSPRRAACGRRRAAPGRPSPAPRRAPSSASDSSSGACRRPRGCAPPRCSSSRASS